MERVFLGLVMALLVSCPSGRAASEPMSRAEVRAQVAALADLGAELFKDTRLSPSGQLSCASCHSPAHAFGPPNGLPVQFGGGDMRQAGLRATPSIRYLQAVPQFTEHFHESEDEADESIDNGATGGLTWDGRADSGRNQARIPLLSDFEMANANPDEVVANVLKAGYGPQIVAIYGEKASSDSTQVFNAVLKALEVYEQDWRVFYPYSSKYDAWLAGKAVMTPAEARGLKLFEDPQKGNCASCHFSARGGEGTAPQFSDFGMIALGLPRNPAIPANRNPGYYDLGLCGPLRTDLAQRADYCGEFRTPTLRNVATRHTFFHNGVLHSLRDAVAFYATRDTDPGRWYPRKADGSIDKFNDMPARYQGNVNMDAPFGGAPGGQPTLGDAEIDDIVTFLGTLTDGWQ